MGANFASAPIKIMWRGQNGPNKDVKGGIFTLDTLIFPFCLIGRLEYKPILSKNIIVKGIFKVSERCQT